MDDLDEINRLLAELADERRRLADDDFAALHALARRRDELRAAAERLRRDADEDRPTHDIRAELAARESQLESMVGESVDMVTQAGGSEAWGGFASAGESGINKRMLDAKGADQVRARIARLRQILEQRDDA